MESDVETWGYPLRYDLGAPILSRGYVAGYMACDTTPRGTSVDPNKVQCLIINGAFNPGNSGGPLVDRQSDKVIGVVEAKWGLYLPDVEQIVNALPKSGVQTSGGKTIVYLTMPDGTRRELSQQEQMALALNEIYESSQVFVGEAIAISELKATIAAHESELLN